MKFNLFEKILLGVIIFLAIFFRTNHLEGKLTFEWDQSRDFASAEKIIKSGELPLLGPVVRGDLGGFYLGPLYYYLVTPLYFATGGNPISLGVISIGVDVFVIIFLYSFLRKRLSWQSAAIAIIIWAGSPLIIHDSYTPWNVSLISLWTISFITVLDGLWETGRFRYKFLAIFLSSLTLNIHLSLVPVAALCLLFNFKSFIKLNLKQYLYLLVALIIPISTLILYDLTHSLENLRLFKQFMLTVTDKSGGIIPIFILVMQKFGYTIGRLFTGEPYTSLGLVLVSVITLAGIMNQKHKRLAVLSLLTIIAVLGALIYYHDFDFAEYYFMPTYIPVLLLTAITLDGILKMKVRHLVHVLIILFASTYLYLGNRVRQEPISPYSLTVKKEVIQEMKKLDYPVEVRTVLPRERNTAFPYLMGVVGLTSDPSASRKAYIYESRNLEVVAPAEARSIILDKPVQAFKLIIFSN